MDGIQPCHNLDQLRLMSILELATAPLSMDEIQAAIASTGEHWSLRTINGVLVSLMTQISHEKMKPKGEPKVTKYWLKSKAFER